MEIFANSDFWVTINRYAYKKTDAYTFSSKVSIQRIAALGHYALIEKTLEDMRDAMLPKNIPSLFESIKGIASAKTLVHFYNKIALMVGEEKINLYANIIHLIVQAVFHEMDFDAVKLLTCERFRKFLGRISEDLIIQFVMKADNTKDGLPLLQWYHENSTIEPSILVHSCLTYAIRTGNLSLLQWINRTFSETLSTLDTNHGLLAWDEDILFAKFNEAFYDELYATCSFFRNRSIISTKNVLMNNDSAGMAWILRYYSKNISYLDEYILYAIKKKYFDVLEVFCQDTPDIINRVFQSVCSVRKVGPNNHEDYMLHMDIHTDGVISKWIREHVYGDYDDTSQHFYARYFNQSRIPLYEIAEHFVSIGSLKNLIQLADIHKRNPYAFLNSRRSFDPIIRSSQNYDFPHLTLACLRYLRYANNMLNISCCRFALTRDGYYISGNEHRLISFGIWSWKVHNILAVDLLKIYSLFRQLKTSLNTLFWKRSESDANNDENIALIQEYIDNNKMTYLSQQFCSFLDLTDKNSMIDTVWQYVNFTRSRSVPARFYELFDSVGKENFIKYYS